MTLPTCGFCHQPFADVTTCTAPEAAHTRPHDGHTWWELTIEELTADPERYRGGAVPCRDCRVGFLGQHHPGCCVARCSGNGEEEQALLCDCPRCDPVVAYFDQLRQAGQN
jgi:hypothetical protein